MSVRTSVFQIKAQLNMYCTKNACNRLLELTIFSSPHRISCIVRSSDIVCG